MKGRNPKFVFTPEPTKAEKAEARAEAKAEKAEKAEAKAEAGKASVKVKSDEK